MHTEQQNNSTELDIFEIVRSSQSNKFQSGCILDTEAHPAGLNDHRPCSAVLLSPVLDTHPQWTWLSPRRRMATPDCVGFISSVPDGQKNFRKSTQSILEVTDTYCPPPMWQRKWTLFLLPSSAFTKWLISDTLRRDDWCVWKFFRWHEVHNDLVRNINGGA